MRYGFDYITSGSYAGDWSELYFPVDTTVTLTTTKGDSVTTTFTEGTSIVGTYVGINISSGGIIAYKRSDTEKILLQDSAITALLAQAATDGYTAASGATLTALDTYVKGLKADGIWNKLDLLYVFATNGDSDFATYNIKDPANFQATKVNAPTFTSLEGFTGDGVSAYLDTGWNPTNDAINYALNSASLGVYKRQGTSTISKCLMGALSFSPIVGSHISGGSNLGRLNSANSIQTLSGSYGLGINAIMRNNSSNVNVYTQSGTTPETITLASAGIPNTSIAILARKVATSADSFSDEQVSIAFAGADLSTGASDLFTLTEAYMDALGKGVV